MKQNQIKDLQKLNPENLENIFNVYQLQDGKYFYNLLQTVVFPSDLPPSLFTSYTTTYGDSWPYISYKVYKNPNLWWIILMANNIQDPTILPKPGVNIAIPINDVVKEITSQIRRS